MADPTEDHMDIDTDSGVPAVGKPDDAVAKPKAPKNKFELKKWTAVAFWSWDIKIENCAICRNHLMEPCIECQPNAMNAGSEECVAAWGVCNHAFHLHCIKRWLKTRNACPLDNTEWVYQKFSSGTDAKPPT